MDKLVLNSAGIQELLKSSEIMGACVEVANSLAQSDSGKHSINTRVGRKRCNAEIVLTGMHAKERQEALT